MIVTVFHFSLVSPSKSLARSFFDPVSEAAAHMHGARLGIIHSFLRRYITGIIEGRCPPRQKSSVGRLTAIVEFL